MPIEIRLEEHKCIASGACVLACPEVFSQDEEGIVTLLDESPSAELLDKVQEAADACPAAVIEVEETAGT